MYLFSALHGHGTSCAAVEQRRADRVQAGHEVAVVAEHVERGLAHPGHDPHRRGHVGRVGQLHADVGDRRAERAHRERHHVHRAAAHRALEQVGQRLRASRSGSRQLLVGPASSSRSRADERAVLDPRDVGRDPTAPGRSSAAWRPTAARTSPRRSAPAPAGRTPPPSRRTSGCRRAGSAPRPPLPSRAGGRGWSLAWCVGAVWAMGSRHSLMSAVGPAKRTRGRLRT